MRVRHYIATAVLTIIVALMLAVPVFAQQAPVKDQYGNPAVAGQQDQPRTDRADQARIAGLELPVTGAELGGLIAGGVFLTVGGLALRRVNRHPDTKPPNTPAG